MKINFLLTVFLLVAISLSGQRVVKKVSAKICDCISEIDYRNLSYEEAEIEYGECLNLLLNYEEGLQKAGYDIFTKEGFEDFVIDFNIRLYKKCPGYYDLFEYVFCEPGDTIEANIPDSSYCKEFMENAKFEMIGINDHKYIIEHNGNTQKEIDLTSSYVTYNEIIWVNDCEYILKLISTENRYTETVSKMGTDECIVSILNIVDDTVTFKIELNDIYYNGKMKKINKSIDIDHGDSIR